MPITSCSFALTGIPRARAYLAVCIFTERRWGLHRLGHVLRLRPRSTHWQNLAAKLTIATSKV